MSSLTNGRVGAGGGHDVGGVQQSMGPVVVEDKPLLFWEQSLHAVAVILSSRNPPIVTTDELRRGVEALEPSAYESWGYYEQRGAALASLLLEKGVITQVALDKELMGESAGGNGASSSEPVVQFQVGDKVRVRPEDTRLRWRRPHLRCPGYIYESVGVVTKYVGTFDDPFLLAFRGKGPQQPLYVVSFPLASIWQSQLGRAAAAAEDGTGSTTSSTDVSDTPPDNADLVELDIYQEWLEPYIPEPSSSSTTTSPSMVPLQLDHDGVCIQGQSQGENKQSGVAPPASAIQDHGHSHSHADHDHSHSDAEHDHSHSHAHLPRITVECNAVTNEGEDSPGKVVAAALMRLLYALGVVTVQEVLTVVNNLENAKLRMDGATLVAHAWLDPDFKARLLADGSAAGAELGIKTSNPNAPTVLRVVENTPQVHNVVVCTLCSCYPIGLLGLPPSWYKSRSYRARMVREPRKVMAEFGTHIPPNVRVVVHDATADCRYLVLPMMPAEAEGITDIEQLRNFATRDSMVGVTVL